MKATLLIRAQYQWTKHLLDSRSSLRLASIVTSHELLVILLSIARLSIQPGPSRRVLPRAFPEIEMITRGL